MYTTKEHYLAALKRACKRLPPLDTKERRKAFWKALPSYGFDPFIEYGIQVGGDKVDEASFRDYLAWELAQLKYDGKVPPPHVLQITSLFDIKGWEIDTHREFCWVNIQGRALNQPVLPGGFPRTSAQIIPFPANRVVRRIELELVMVA